MSGQERAAAVIRAALVSGELSSSELEWDESPPGTFVVTMPGTRKLRTTCSLAVGAHAVSVNAFVARHPDENDAEVHRWLLERNARMYGVAFALDQHGDIYLTGRLPLHAVTPDELDRVLGSVLTYADGSFNAILERGFASSIRREYAWRVSRGEPTYNLAAFRHITGEGPPGAAE